MVKKNINIACAILAGGKNTRIGGLNKAFIKIEETNILKKITVTLENIFDEIIIVTNTYQEYNLLKDKYIITNDKIKNIGPLGGIYSALLQTTKKAIFIVACDMPYLHNDVIQKEINTFNTLNCDAVVPRIGHYVEPLHSIYRKNITDKLYLFIKDHQNYSISNFLKIINVNYLDFEDNDFYKKVFTNINTLKDLERIKNLTL